MVENKKTVDNNSCYNYHFDDSWDCSPLDVVGHVDNEHRQEGWQRYEDHVDTVEYACNKKYSFGRIIQM